MKFEVKAEMYFDDGPAAIMAVNSIRAAWLDVSTTRVQSNHEDIPYALRVAASATFTEAAEAEGMAERVGNYQQRLKESYEALADNAYFIRHIMAEEVDHVGS